MAEGCGSRRSCEEAEAICCAAVIGAEHLAVEHDRVGICDEADADALLEEARRMRPYVLAALQEAQEQGAGRTAGGHLTGAAPVHYRAERP